MNFAATLRDVCIGDRSIATRPRGAPIIESKKSAAGFALRHALVSAHFASDAYKTVRARSRRNQASDDDILDAFAALWTAERIIRGAAQVLPANSPMNSVGRPMRIVY